MAAETHYAGAEWIGGTSWGRVKALSPLGRAVADLLGDIFFGIYHLETKALMKAQWDDPYVIILVLRCRLSTFDNDSLTRLVVLCHDRCIRCHITGKGPGYIELMFHRRQREGSMYERHPTLEAAAARIRGDYQVKEPSHEQG